MNMKKKNCHILGLNIKMYYQIVSLFDMYIDMGERIAVKQDKCSHINAQGPLNSPKYVWTFWLIYAKFVSPCCTYVSIVMRSAFADISVPLVPMDFI